MELLEREQFLNDLEAMRNDVAAGKGRFVLVSGEAGIGKTALVERFAAEQEHVLWGACDALFTPRPLGPLYDIAQQTHGKLLRLLEEGAPCGPIFSAVLDEINSESGLTLIVIEDIHWADESTLDLLKFLGRRIHRTKAMIIVTYRDDEMATDHPLRHVLGDLPHRSVTRLRLPPLSEAAVDTLTRRAGRPIEDLYAVTGGNPFFVTEALASKDPGIPVTVSDAVLSRVTRLSMAAREMLELVSVIPAKAEIWLVEEVIHPSTTVLEECLGAGMLRSDGEALAFRHELARRATEASLGVQRQRTLHTRVLERLLERKSETLLPRIVHHAVQAGDTATVITYAPAAAKQAAALNSHREAASHYTTALNYADSLAPEDRAELLECCSFEYYLSGQVDKALIVRRQAIELCKELGAELRQGDNLRWASRLAWGAGHGKEAEDYGAEAVTILENLPPGPELAMAYSNRSQLHMLLKNWRTLSRGVREQSSLRSNLVRLKRSFMR